VLLKNGHKYLSAATKTAGSARSIRWARSSRKFNNNSLPAGTGLSLGNVQECNRLANGNTVICTWQGEPSVLEETLEKKTVWMLSKKYLGNSSSMQLLDEPSALGDGELQR
jgi:hypothetical protein